MGDDPIVTINSVNSWGKELVPFVDSGAVEIVLPMSVYRGSSGGEVAEWSWFQGSERVTHQAP